MLVQQNTIGTLARPFRAEYYRRAREAGTAVYYKRIQEVVLVQQSTKGALECYTGGVEYCKSTLEAVLVHQRIIGALGRLCWYSRVL